MAFAKVTQNGVTIMDVTQDTVAENTLLSGVTATKNDGTKITGNIPEKTSSDLSVSGATVSVPAGHYASAASASVPAGSAATPATTINAQPSISVDANGLITASNNASQSVTPSVSAGYVSAGEAGTISVSGSNTSQLTAQAAQTITPTTTDQTIASGKYLTGAQTIKGDANLVAENIAKDVTIFGVTGTHEGGGGGDGYVWQDENGYVHLSPSGGGGNSARKDVNFYDYDGRLVAAYTTAEFANITELPANPTHTGLTAQGWNMPSNWSLADAKTYIATNKKADWGQMYITDDGKTRVYIHLEEGRLSPMLGCCPDGTVDVDWGDGTSHDTLTGTNASTVQWTSNHTYAAAGDYVIKLTVTGSMGFYGSSSTYQYSGLLRYSSSGDSRNKTYLNAIRRVEIGSGITSIGNSAFYNCCNLTSLTIPSGVTGISNYAFDDCHGLTSIVIPNSVTWIGSNAFAICYSLTNITIPNSVTSISSYAFASCYSLTNITIPGGVTSISDNVFASCYSLTNIAIPSNVTSIGDNAFVNCSSLTSITIPNDVTSIGSNAFYNCYSLMNITIPNGVTSIGSYAFFNCSNLTNITIPSGVTSISSNAFYNCSSLTSITIPSDVTSIENNAFNSCFGVGALHFKSETPPTIANAYVFSSILTDCIIYVPTGTLETYTSAQYYPSSSTYTYVEE